MKLGGTSRAKEEHIAKEVSAEKLMKTLVARHDADSVDDGGKLRGDAVAVTAMLDAVPHRRRERDDPRPDAMVVYSAAVLRFPWTGRPKMASLGVGPPRQPRPAMRRDVA